MQSETQFLLNKHIYIYIYIYTLNSQQILVETKFSAQIHLANTFENILFSSYAPNSILGSCRMLRYLTVYILDQKSTTINKSGNKYLSSCSYINIYICVCVCVCIYIYIYIHTHTHEVGSYESVLGLHLYLLYLMTL